MSRPPPSRAQSRREEIERMFGDLVREDASRDVVGARHHDDEYSGHGRYFPPWSTGSGAERTEYGVRTAGAWAALWRDWELRPYWRPPEAAKVRDALAERQAAITALATQLLPRLTPAETEVYRLHYVAGLSLSAIARQTRRQRNTVTQLLGRLKAKAAAIAGGNR